MKSQREPEKLLPLTPAVFHILLALADGEKHGYSIMREISERTAGQMRVGPARCTVLSSACSNRG